MFNYSNGEAELRVMEGGRPKNSRTNRGGKSVKFTDSTYGVLSAINQEYLKNKPKRAISYEDYVMTVVWIGDPTAFVIKSKNNAEKYKEFFLETWKKGEHLTINIRSKIFKWSKIFTNHDREILC